MFDKCQNKEADLYFQNVCVKYELNDGVVDVTGGVKGGQILGVFGPKGCGKTTLLTALSGLSPVSRGEIRVGSVSLERSRGKIAYCPAADVFLPTLTVQETLEYAAKLHLQVDLPTSNLSRRIAESIDLLQLDFYRNCLVQFLDTATRKRLSIACAMLTCPDVLLLDEPLLGLTFGETMCLLKLLHIYVQKTARTLVIATSTCPGVVYQSCSQYLFLFKSRVAFSGAPQELVRFMGDTEICCTTAYNPAEYFLELLCEENLDDSKPIQEKITEAFRNRERTTVEPSSCSCGVKSSVEDLPRGQDGVHKNANSKSTPEVDEAVYLIEDGAGKSAVTELSIIRYKQKWSMPYWREFLVLLDRNFHNARRRILFPIGGIQNLYILIICVLVWWRPERNEDTVKDRMGLFFFTVVQWAFFALLDAILTFPKELKVVNRERSFGRYRLSAYCLSKTLSELPLAIIQPGVYLCVIYWVANLNGLSAFLASLGILVLNVIAAQSIGLFVGAVLQPPFTVSIVSLGLLSMMLLGGAFNTPPQWLHWGKFTSFFYYGLNAFIYLELTNAPPIKCLQDSLYHTVPVCTLLQPGTNTTIPDFPSDLLLEPLGVEWPLWAYVIVLVGILVVTRLLWYILLRRKKLN